MTAHSIAELSAEANAYVFNTRISFSNWVYACQTLLREASIYDLEEREKNQERVYVLSMRFLDLVVNKLRTHPDFAQSKAAYNRLLARVPEVIHRCEELKKSINHTRAETVKEPEPRKVFQELDLDDEIAAFHSAHSGSYPLRVSDIALPSPHRLRRAPPSEPRVEAPRLDTSGYTLVHVPGDAGGAAALPPPLPVVMYPKAHSPIAAPRIPEKEVPAGARIDSLLHSELVLPSDSKLRNVFVPAELRSRFLELSAKNTAAKVETCGMLCGKLVKNAFFVTDLLVPHQESTPDSCSTTNEEEIFEYVDARDLFILGWIHTHPTQSCFMSSVDLHTHASYQIMLPEAVAIVCAPRHTPAYGVFRLTDPPGIDVIKACTQRGFHPHEQKNLYASASPGHYHEFDFDLQVTDPRPALLAQTPMHARSSHTGSSVAEEENMFPPEPTSLSTKLQSPSHVSQYALPSVARISPPNSPHTNIDLSDVNIPWGPNSPRLDMNEYLQGLASIPQPAEDTPSPRSTKSVRAYAVAASDQHRAGTPSKSVFPSTKSRAEPESGPERPRMPRPRPLPSARRSVQDTSSTGARKGTRPLALNPFTPSLKKRKLTGIADERAMMPISSNIQAPSLDYSPKKPRVPTRSPLKVVDRPLLSQPQPSLLTGPLNLVPELSVLKDSSRPNTNAHEQAAIVALKDDLRRANSALASASSQLAEKQRLVFNLEVQSRRAEEKCRQLTGDLRRSQDELARNSKARRVELQRECKRYAALEQELRRVTAKISIGERAFESPLWFDTSCGTPGDAAVRQALEASKTIRRGYAEHQCEKMVKILERAFEIEPGDDDPQLGSVSKLEIMVNLVAEKLEQG